MRFRDQSIKGRQARANIIYRKIRSHVNPCGEEILVSNEIAETLLCTGLAGILIVSLFVYIFPDAVFIVSSIQEPVLLFVGKIFIENEAKDIVLVLICLDL